MPNVEKLQPDAILLWDKSLQQRKCDPVKAFDDKLAHLVERLTSACYLANGLGLAAPQIGEFVRVAVIHFPPEKPAFPIVNPEIDVINSKGEQTDHEGCLSLPTLNRVNVRVRRCHDVVFSYQDLTGRRIEDKVSGLLARVIQHEVDHLDGFFYIDRIGDLSRSMVLRSFHKYKAQLEFKPAQARR